MAGKENQIKLAEALREYEANGEIFTCDMLVSRTPYPKNTINKYINEKLLNQYIFHCDSKKNYRCEGLLSLSNEAFLALMSQSVQAKTPSAEEQFYIKLTEKSLDAFTLALEVYNRPSLKNRVEAFTIMMVNAWELLLKAELLKSSGYDSIVDESEMSIPITTAINRQLKENDPVRKNLEHLVELRNKAIHLLIPELQQVLSRLFQATVLNFQTRYRNEVGSSPLAGQSVGMLSLVLDGPETEVAVIQKHYGNATAKIVDKFLNNLSTTSTELDSKQFAIPVNYHLALVKREDQSDVSLNAGSDGASAMVIHKTVGPEVTHPYKTNEAICEINKRSPDHNIKSGAFHAVIHKHKLKNQTKSKMRYVLDDRPRYSEEFVNWFVENLKQPEWLDSSIRSRATYLNRERKKNTKARRMK